MREIDWLPLAYAFIGLGDAARAAAGAVKEFAVSFLENRGDHYILDEDGEPVSVDLMTWAHWFETIDQGRVVLRTKPTSDAEVSTVFLSLNHDWNLKGRPVLWETMVFGGPFDGLQNRYRSKLDALTGHALIEALVAVYRELPRRAKWAMRKWAKPYREDFSSWVLRPGERRQVERVLRRIGWKD